MHIPEEYNDAVRSDDGGLPDILKIKKIWVSGQSVCADIKLFGRYGAIHGYNEKGLFVNPKQRRGAK